MWLCLRWRDSPDFLSSFFLALHSLTGIFKFIFSGLFEIIPFSLSLLQILIGNKAGPRIGVHIMLEEEMLDN